MDERLAADSLVEGVYPAARRGRRAGDRPPDHLLVRLALVHDHAPHEAVRHEVVGAYEVLDEVAPVRMLEQVQRAPVRRERVEAELALQRDRPQRTQA